MARTAVDATKVRNPQEAVTVTGTLITANSSASPQYLAIDGQDERTAFIVSNADSSNAIALTIIAGEGYAASTDCVISVPKSATVAFYIDSNKYKILTGEEVNSVAVYAGTASKLTVQVIALGVAATETVPTVV